MKDDEIRARLRDEFRAARLPRSMPSSPAGELQGRETIIVNGGRGQQCSACAEMISASEQGSIEYRYPTQTTRFHPRQPRCCELAHGRGS
jgi:hypothetical protein